MIESGTREDSVGNGEQLREDDLLRELELALAVEPSLRFGAAVRAAVARPVVSRMSWRYVLPAAAIAGAAVVVALTWGTPRGVVQDSSTDSVRLAAPPVQSANASAALSPRSDAPDRPNRIDAAELPGRALPIGGADAIPRRSDLLPAPIVPRDRAVALDRLLVQRSADHPGADAELEQAASTSDLFIQAPLACIDIVPIEISEIETAVLAIPAGDIQ